MTIEVRVLSKIRWSWTQIFLLQRLSAVRVWVPHPGHSPIVLRPSVGNL